MSCLESLFAADEKNRREMARLLAGFDAWLPVAPDEGIALYHSFLDLLACNAGDEPDRAELHKIAGEIGLTDDELAAKLPSDCCGGPMLRAGLVFGRLRARECRRFLTLYCASLFEKACADLFRLRVTPCFGYLRLQAEAVAFIGIFRHRADAAGEWLQLPDFPAGLKFYQKYKRDVRQWLALQPRLALAYEFGSAASMHVRMAGLFRALRYEPSLGRLSLVHQELDPTDPAEFLKAYLFVLDTQLGVWEVLSKGWVEIDTSSWRPTVGAFGERVQRALARLAEVFPEPETT